MFLCFFFQTGSPHNNATIPVLDCGAARAWWLRKPVLKLMMMQSRKILLSSMVKDYRILIVEEDLPQDSDGGTRRSGMVSQREFWLVFEEFLEKEKLFVV